MNTEPFMRSSNEEEAKSSRSRENSDMKVLMLERGGR